MFIEFLVFWFIIILTFCIGFFVGFIKFVEDSPERLKKGLQKFGLGFTNLTYQGKNVTEEEEEIGYAREITEEERDRRLHPEKYTYEEAESTKILKERILNQHE